MTLFEFLSIVYNWGWVVLPLILFPVWKELWLAYVKKIYVENVEWATLELKIPQAVEQTPKAMEQVFAGLHSIKSFANFKEKWWDGKHQLPISMEIVGNAGAIRFFIRAPRVYQELVESQIYSQYKDAEIDEVEDYAWDLPDDVPNDQYGLWGTELILTKEDAYPIRTYRFFEEPISEKKFIDPLSSLVEVLGRLATGEQVWLQYLIRPARDDRWQKEGRKLADRLMGKETPAKGGENAIEEVFRFLVDMVSWIWGETSQLKKEEKPKEQGGMKELSPGMKEVLGALEESISKHGFEAGIRIVYIAKTDAFAIHTIPALLGTFKQFSTYNLNGFKPNSIVSPSVDYFFKKSREYLRKRSLYRAARLRLFVRKQVILNTEELATVYHIPSIMLEVPTLTRIAAKKVEPPAGLPSI